MYSHLHYNLLLCSFSDSCSIRNFEEEHFLPRSPSSKTISLQEPAGVHHLTHQLTCRLPRLLLLPPSYFRSVFPDFSPRLWQLIAEPRCIFSPFSLSSSSTLVCLHPNIANSIDHMAQLLRQRYQLQPRSRKLSVLPQRQWRSSRHGLTP